jgi:hypothetical protein
VPLKIAYARSPHFIGRCLSPAKALVANTIASQPGTPYDNPGGAAGRRRSPGPNARVGVGKIRTLERPSTRWRAPSETPTPSWPIPRHRSSRRPTRPGASSGTITIHSPKGQGTTVRAGLSILSLGSRPTAFSGRVVRAIAGDITQPVDPRSGWPSTPGDRNEFSVEPAEVALGLSKYRERREQPVRRGHPFVL